MKILLALAVGTGVAAFASEPVAKAIAGTEIGQKVGKALGPEVAGGMVTGGLAGVAVVLVLG